MSNSNVEAIIGLMIGKSCVDQLEEDIAEQLDGALCDRRMAPDLFVRENRAVLREIITRAIDRAAVVSLPEGWVLVRSEIQRGEVTHEHGSRECTGWNVEIQHIEGGPTLNGSGDSLVAAILDASTNANLDGTSAPCAQKKGGE